MKIDNLKWIYRAYRYRLKLERQEIALLLRHLNPGDVGVDVGAHKGAYTYWMSRAVGERGRVFAFEPQPGLAAALQLRAASPRHSNVVVENLGLSSAAGTLTLNVPGEGSSPGATFEADGAGGGRSYPVPVTTLDDYFGGRADRPVRLLKCDAEGHELEVFRGGSGLLSSDRPCLLFECERRHRAGGRVEEVFAFLEGLGYRGYFIQRGGPQDIERFDPDVHQADSEASGYVNNFLFLAA